ncbi:MAG: hypothetical protein ABH827_02765 [bacterium]
MKCSINSHIDLYDHSKKYIFIVLCFLFIFGGQTCLQADLPEQIGKLQASLTQLKTKLILLATNLNTVKGNLAGKKDLLEVTDMDSAIKTIQDAVENLPNDAQGTQKRQMMAINNDWWPDKFKKLFIDVGIELAKEKPSRGVIKSFLNYTIPGYYNVQWFSLFLDDEKLKPACDKLLGNLDDLRRKLELETSKPYWKEADRIEEEEARKREEERKRRLGEEKDKTMPRVRIDKLFKGIEEKGGVKEEVYVGAKLVFKTDLELGKESAKKTLGIYKTFYDKFREDSEFEGWTFPVENKIEIKTPYINTFFDTFFTEIENVGNEENFDGKDPYYLRALKECTQKWCPFTRSAYKPDTLTMEYGYVRELFENHVAEKTDEIFKDKDKRFVFTDFASGKFRPVFQVLLKLRKKGFKTFRLNFIDLSYKDVFDYIKTMETCGVKWIQEGFGDFKSELKKLGDSLFDCETKETYKIPGQVFGTTEEKHYYMHGCYAIAEWFDNVEIYLWSSAEAYIKACEDNPGLKADLFTALDVNLQGIAAEPCGKLINDVLFPMFEKTLNKEALLFFFDKERKSERNQLIKDESIELILYEWQRINNINGQVAVSQVKNNGGFAVLEKIGEHASFDDFKVNATFKKWGKLVKDGGWSKH